MGYWQKLLKERNDLITLGGNTVEARRRADEARRQQYSRDNLRFVDVDRAKGEEELYRKVCAILDEDEDVINPIGKLIDEKEYAKMDSMAKQKYVLYLSKKYREMRDRYYLEKMKTC
jgi:hypothetical protein